MATTIKTTFQLRRGNAEVWAKNNPVLAAGEPAFELDTGKLKIGNGNDAYNNLPYVGIIEAANPSFVPVVWNAENNSVTSSYTYNQVRELVDKGKDVVVKVEMSNLNTTNYLYLVSDMGTAFTFYSGVSLGEGARRIVLLWDEASIRGYQEKVVTEDDYSNNVPLQASATPSAGVSTFVSRADHVHPAELPEGATAFQQLVTDSDGSTKWEDRPGGYTQIIIGDYVYSKANNFNTFHDFCWENNYEIGDTITVVCNGVTYENVPITANYEGGVHLEQAGVFSFGNVEYYGGGYFGGADDVFPDGVTEVTFKNVHQVNDIVIPEKYMAYALDKKLDKSGGNVSGELMVSGENVHLQIINAPREGEDEKKIYHELLLGNRNVSIRSTYWPIMSGGHNCLQLNTCGLILELTRSYDIKTGLPEDFGNVYFNHPVTIQNVKTPTVSTDAASKEYVDSRLFTFTITPTNGPGSQMLSATRAEMLAALDAGKTLLGYWTETRTILGTTDTIKHEFRLESVSGTGADRGLAFVNYEQFYKSTLYVNGNDTVSFVDKEQLPNPMTKTEAMTQSVGMDDDGRLWTEPGASGLPDGATANQYLVTDSDGNAVWENRPGGYDVETITNTDTRTLTFKATETAGDYKADVDMWNGVHNDGTFPLDRVYDVTFNGVKYRDIRPIQAEYSNGGYLGDPALVAYPFYIGGDREFMGSGIYLYYVHANVSGTIEVTIETHGTKTVKIPRGYVETPNCVVTDLSSNYWGASIYDEKDNSYLLERRVDGETWLRTNADHFYIDSQQPIISNGAPMRFQSYNGSSMVSEKYGLELGNGYIVLASSTANSTKKFRITVDDSGTLTATEITTA